MGLIEFYSERFARATDEVQMQSEIAFNSANGMIGELIKNNKQLFAYMKKEDLQKAADEFCFNPKARAVQKLKRFLKANFMKDKRLHLTGITSQIHYIDSAELVGIYVTWQIEKQFYTLFIPCFEYLTAETLNVVDPICCGKYVLFEPSDSSIAHSNRMQEATWYPEDIAETLSDILK